MRGLSDDATEYARLEREAEDAIGQSAGQGTRSPTKLWSVLIGGTVLIALLSLLVGRGSALADVNAVFLVMRAHRVIVGFLCGASLAVAGAVVQGLFRNPMASPHMLGVPSAATLGAHVGLLFAVFTLGGGAAYGLAPEMFVPIGALLGALLSLFLLLTVVSRRIGPLALLLTGYALMALFQGLSSFLTNRFQEAWELNRAMQSINMGNLSSAGARQVWLAVIMTVGGAAPVLLASPTLDVLLAGDEEATALGVDVRGARFWLVTWVAVMTAGTVAVGGSLSFVGLIVPHALRHFVGQRHRLLLPASFLAGGAFVMLCDTLVRLFPSRLELPLGVLTDLIGAPIFLRMLLQMARAGRLHG